VIEGELSHDLFSKSDPVNTELNGHVKAQFKTGMLYFKG
jgi:hypothetical protein